ncbi:uncharacterized protein TRIADDRAFT_60937 [Trichoplax adhaerens]|uniref:Uncharacterized protein n=1 Tax=Trichoplax adhaerens TaxID=10228 RepID=B3S9K2_TRIAD|nr:hypothetical protein TRIADDRAFT_60937 [Trichoplax adhaerens]EDV20489.1 hypothetical protein TRIADDRAFT_60937 [Trichoplax adhaerens]|eukprot:XP_002116915.1 hypothetical protein TRIADDRAFT_60937 [Trichoplax adhaerens]
MTTFVGPTVFPLAFQINATFQRRERVLEYLAEMKAALMELLFCHKNWTKPAGLPNSFARTTALRLQELIVSIHLYLLQEKEKERLSLLRTIYHLLSSLSERNEIIRDTPLCGAGPLCTRVIHYHNLICHSFEKLRIIREYRSPRSIMSFTKVFIFMMPILLSPTYVYIGIKAGSDWAAYYVATLTAFLFGCLQAVSDALDDPFDGIGQDDVNFKQFENWPEVSLLEFTRIGGQEKRATDHAKEDETRKHLVDQDITYVTDPIERGDAIQTDEKWHSIGRGNLMSCSDAIGPEDVVDDVILDDNIDVGDKESLENQPMVHDGMYSWTSRHNLDDIYDYIHDGDENPHGSIPNMEVLNIPNDNESYTQTKSPKKQLPTKANIFDSSGKRRTMTMDLAQRPTIRKANSSGGMPAHWNSLGRTVASPNKQSNVELGITNLNPPEVRRQLSYSPTDFSRFISVDRTVNTSKSQVNGRCASPLLTRPANLEPKRLLSTSQVLLQTDETII